MEEETLKLLLWVVFIAVWIISAFAKKKRDSARADTGGESGAAGQEQLYEGYPDEEYTGPDDELAKLFRTIAGVEEKTGPARAPEPVRQPAGTMPRKKPAEPVRAPSLSRRPGPVEEVILTELREPPAGHKVIPQTVSRLGRLDREKLRRGVILSEVLGPPRALKHYLPGRVR